MAEAKSGPPPVCQKVFIFLCLEKNFRKLVMSENYKKFKFQSPLTDYYQSHAHLFMFSLTAAHIIAAEGKLM